MKDDTCSPKKISLFRFCLHLIGFGLLLSILHCERVKPSENSVKIQPSEQPKTETSYYTESPEIKTLADQGLIPPVENRLPVNPVLIQPEEEAGTYGGVWRMGLLQPWEYRKIFAFIEYETLVRWNPQWEKIIPNIAQSVEVNDSMTVFTFVLRKGMKWSDGADFTAGDIEYWYEHIFRNPDVTPHIPFWLESNGGTAGFQKIDLQTFRFLFDKPQPFFLEYLAHPEGAEITRYPKHFLMRIESTASLPANTSENSQTGIPGNILEIQAGYVCDQCWNPGQPTLNAWEPYQKNSRSIVFHRNPYYWKIDLEFRQLPYIDRVEFRLYPSPDAFVKAIKRGEIHYIDSYLASLQCISDLDHQNSGQRYYDINLVASESNSMAMGLNQCHPDEERRNLFQNKQFRVALSLAIDRETIISQILDEEVCPCQPGPSIESPFYHEDLSTQYTAYLPDSSRKLITSALSDFPEIHKSSGGTSYLILKTIVPREMSYLFLWEKILRQVREQWRRVGVDMRIEVLDHTNFYQRIRRGDFDLVIMPGFGGIDPVINPALFFPFDQHSCYAYPWAMAFQSGHSAKANCHPPVPETALKQMALYKEMMHTIDPGEQKKLMKQILDLSAEAFYVIGICEMPDRTAWVRSDCYNVLPVMPYAWSYPTPGPSNPCQYTLSSSE